MSVKPQLSIRCCQPALIDRDKNLLNSPALTFEKGSNEMDYMFSFTKHDLFLIVHEI